MGYIRGTSGIVGLLLLANLGACKTGASAIGGGTTHPEPTSEASDKTPEELAKNYDVTLYVAANGNDAQTFNQVDQDNPLKSISKVNEFLKNNAKVSIAVLFHRGDTWLANGGTLPYLSINRGQVLIGAYGDGTVYPRIGLTGDGNADTGVINISNPDEVIFKGLYVYSENPVKAFRVGINVIGGTSSHLEFSDVVVNGFYHNIAVQGGWANNAHTYQELVLDHVKIINGRTTELPFENGKRTGSVVGDYSSSSGMYIVEVTSVKIIDSIIANNGNQLAQNNARPHYSFYNHQIYFGSSDHQIENVNIQRTLFMTTFPKLPEWIEGGNVTTKDFSAKASPWLEGPDGLKTPVQNVTLQNNLFYGLQKPFWARRNTAIIDDNVIFGTRGLSKCSASNDMAVCFSKWGGGVSSAISGGGEVGGAGISGGETLTDSYFRRNLCTHRNLSSSAECFDINGLLDPDYATKPNVSGNVVYDWNGPLGISDKTTGLTKDNFNLQNSFTAYGQTNSKFPSPERSFDNYVPGGNSEVEFVKRVVQQGEGKWDASLTAPAMNDYTRAGYGMPAAK